ncbi:MFS transporter [Nicoliella lavandulae]|uniref:MFS transporter n=1 Tax=Nicoliella lavandulae TaxID=3082954 RepID=A0ABU8SMH7_9LACO
MMTANNYTLTQRIDTAKESPLFYKIFALVGAGMMLDAADVYMASTINSSIIATHFATLNQGSTFLSVGFLGLFIGSIITGYLGDFFGRRATYHWNLLIFSIATLIGAFSINIEMLIATRFIAAIGLGAEIVTGYSMISEFAPVNKQGKWSGMIAIIANLGAPLGLLLSTILIGNYGWRSMFIFIGLCAFILFFCRRNLPESPRWLIQHGRKEEAQSIIEKLELKGHYDEDQSTNKNAMTINKGRGLLVAITAVSASLLCQYTFTSWVPTLLAGRGISIIHSMWFATIMMIGAPIGAFIGSLLIDRLGHKFTIVPAFILTAIAGIAYGFETTAFGTIANGFILTTLLYILIASNVSVYAPELFATNYRFRGTGFANGIAKLLTTLSPYMVLFIITKYNPTMIFFIIAGISLFAALIVGFFGPETKQQPIK